MVTGVATATDVVIGVARDNPSDAVSVGMGDGDSAGETVAATALEEVVVATVDDECVPLLPQPAARNEAITRRTHKE